MTTETPPTITEPCPVCRRWDTAGIEARITSNKSWYYLLGDCGDIDSDKITDPILGLIEVVDGKGNDWIGDDWGHQGSTDEVYAILKIQGKFFRKNGTSDSYGNYSWDGPLFAVQAKEKTVYTYEYE